jgi:hypothetical protein
MSFLPKISAEVRQEALTLLFAIPLSVLATFALAVILSSAPIA